mmetsp:Transcript_14315/g.38623  ORF Transcript_14315/g.38623 Transcript_14315/m.38623 type:complete len:138 (-) Transcript_14315:85-498(-)
MAEHFLDGDGTCAQLSPYEKARATQIIHNKRVLRELGLESVEPLLEKHGVRKVRKRVASTPHQARARPERRRVTKADKTDYASLHLFGRDLSAWPLKLPPVYTKKLAAQSLCIVWVRLQGLPLHVEAAENEAPSNRP